MKHLSCYELQELCVRNNWFTAGSIKQYKKLFDRNDEEASLEELAIIIWICSSDVSRPEVYNKLLDAAMSEPLT